MVQKNGMLTFYLSQALQGLRCGRRLRRTYWSRQEAGLGAEIKNGRNAVDALSFFNLRRCSSEVATAIRGALIMAKMHLVPIRRGYWGSTTASENENRRFFSVLRESGL